MSNCVSFLGPWAYRSFHNDPDLEKPFNDLRFGHGVLRFSEADCSRLAGSLGGLGWELELTGAYALGNPSSFRFQGRGKPKYETWVYDYVGWMVPHWPHGSDQRPAIVGSVIRTAERSGAPAGYVGSFYAVRMDVSTIPGD